MRLPDEVNERLDLLRNSGQIAQETYECVREQIIELLKSNRIEAQSENIGSFTNHLAIAIERMNRGEAIEEVSEQIDEVINDYPELYSFAQQLIDRCLWKEGAYQTRAEAGFITLYLALPQGEKG